MQNKILTVLVALLGTLLFTPEEQLNCLLTKNQAIQDKRFLLLLFPKKTNQELLSPQVRAVTANLEEFRSGLINQTTEDGEIIQSIKKFTLTPENKKRDVLIEKWKSTLSMQGYTDGNFEIKQKNKGHEITFKLIDGRHGRKEIFKYYTENENPTNTWFCEYDWIDRLIKYFLAFFIATSIGILIFKNSSISNKKYLALKKKLLEVFSWH